MKLLFDQNISYRIVKKLIDSYPQFKHVSQVSLNNSEDIDIWQFAKKEGYTIVTFDSDYYDISLINGSPPKIIWLRTGNLSSTQLIELLLSTMDIISDFIQNEEHVDKECLEISSF